MDSRQLCVVKEVINLWSQEETDVVLVSKEGKQVSAHRMILSLLSPQLRGLILSCPLHLTSTIFLPSCSFENIISVINYVYGQKPPLHWDGHQQTVFQATFELLGFNNTSVSTCNQYTNKTHRKEIKATEKVCRNNTDFEMSCDNFGDLVFKCEVCSYHCKTKKFLMKHYIIKHFSASISELVDSFFSKDFFDGTKCKNCGINNKNHSEKLVHIGIVHGKLKEVCENHGINVKHIVPQKKSKNLFRISKNSKFLQKPKIAPRPSKSKFTKRQNSVSKTPTNDFTSKEMKLLDAMGQDQQSEIQYSETQRKILSLQEESSEECRLTTTSSYTEDLVQENEKMVDPENLELMEETLVVNDAGDPTKLLEEFEFESDKKELSQELSRMQTIYNDESKEDTLLAQSALLLNLMLL